MKPIITILALFCVVNLISPAYAQQALAFRSNPNSNVFLANDSLQIETSGTFATEKSGGSLKKFKCWIYGDTSQSFRVRRAYIHSVKDSGIVFSVSSKGNTFFSKNQIEQFRNATDLKVIKIRKNGRVGGGILAGACIGFIAGFVSGYAGIPDYGIFDKLPAAENGAVGGILFSFPGAIIGGIISSGRIIIPINKSQPQYEKQKDLIARYANYR